MFCTLGDVHPNVTAKLIHCSLAFFYLITVMTCDDERDSQLSEGVTCRYIHVMIVI